MPKRNINCRCSKCFPGRVTQNGKRYNHEAVALRIESRRILFPASGQFRLTESIPTRSRRRLCKVIYEYTPDTVTHNIKIRAFRVAAEINQLELVYFIEK